MHLHKNINLVWVCFVCCFFLQLLKQHSMPDSDFNCKSGAALPKSQEMILAEMKPRLGPLFS